MNGPMKLVAPLVAALAVAACSGGSSTVPTTSAGQSVSQSHSIPDWQAKGLATRVCSDARPGLAQCDALLMTGKVQPNVSGWAPADFQARYNLPSSSKGSGQIIAIVDAYDNPNATSDLAAYRTQFGLGTANFTKYNQLGQTKNYPQGNKNWGLEEDLDIQMVSASCPKCTIYLVEANSAYTNDLMTAEAEAVTLGAHVVSNSWGCPGSNNCVASSYFSTPGVVFMASAGDGGYGTQGPAADANVVSVGGTVLSKSGSNYSETAWRGTGSGCATGISKPSWQHDNGCTSRTMNDVSAVAWNAALYDTYGYGGWLTVGGTSVSSPLLAGVYGLAGNASSETAGKSFWTLKKKARKKALHDITSGTNGSCGGSYLCTAGAGYDGPTGWGTPNGVAAF
ncbi:MAG TPA: S53 family peptidase [Candidatus Nitrosotalea sp.]|nr:S53 family peptidase [Candidatus Nitrosotalea sp.]